MADRALVAALFAAAALISGITLFETIQPNDEGLMLQAAARIADGQVPYHDFWWFYPPGQPYVLAALWKVFGPSLLTWRILRVLCDATVAVLVWVLARRGGASQPVAIVAWLAAALAMAYPSGPHPFPPTLAMCLGVLLLMDRRPALAGVLAGLAAFWRLEFAAYLGLGVLLAYGVRAWFARTSGAAGNTDVMAGGAERVAARAGSDRPPGSGRAVAGTDSERLAPGGARAGAVVDASRAGGAVDSSPARVGRAALVFAGTAAAVAVVLYLPVVVAAGFGDSFDLLVRYPIEDFSDYQSLPFPLDYDGVLNTSSLGGFLDDSAESLLLFYLPLALMLGLAGALAALALRFTRERWWQVAAAVFGVGMAHYLVTRPDVFHTAPLAVMVAVLGSWAVAAGGRGRLRARWLMPAAAGVAVVAVAYATVEGLDRRWLELRADRAELRLPVADGVRVREDSRAPLEDAVHFVQRRTQPGQPIYVAPRRSDLVTAGAPLFYVLAERPNPTRYDIAAPGVVTTAPVQREIVRDLERTRTRVVVRWTNPASAAREPNKAGESSGVTLLDDYLAREYRRAARFGEYLVLVRR